MEPFKVGRRQGGGRDLPVLRCPSVCAPCHTSSTGNEGDRRDLVVQQEDEDVGRLPRGTRFSRHRDRQRQESGTGCRHRPAHLGPQVSYRSLVKEGDVLFVGDDMSLYNLTGHCHSTVNCGKHEIISSVDAVNTTNVVSGNIFPDRAVIVVSSPVNLDYVLVLTSRGLRWIGVGLIARGVLSTRFRSRRSPSPEIAE